MLAATDPAKFALLHFGWEAYPYQERVMDAVLVEGKRRVAWCAGRRVGKTYTNAQIALQLAILRPPHRVAFVAPTLQQARLPLDLAKTWLARSPFARYARKQTTTELRLEFGNDARGVPLESVLFAMSVGQEVRGQGADALFVDEAVFCPRDDLLNKALPIVASAPGGGTIVHTSTIWAEDDEFMSFYRDFARRPDGAVFTTPTSENPRIEPSALEDYRRIMLPSEYAREFECRLIGEDGVFDHRALKACLRDYELFDLASLERAPRKRNHVYYVGVDWGKKQDQTVIAVVEQGTQQKANPARLVFLQKYRPDPQSTSHYTRIIDDVVRVARHFRADKTVADEGEGGHQAEVLRRPLGGSKFEAYRFTKASRDWLINNARMLVERKALELPFQPDDAVRAFRSVRRTDDGFEHESRRGKDVFDAIALALRPVGEAAAREDQAPMRLMPAEAGSKAGRARKVAEAPRVHPLRPYFDQKYWRYLK